MSICCLVTPPYLSLRSSSLKSLGSRCQDCLGRLAARICTNSKYCAFLNVGHVWSIAALTHLTGHGGALEEGGGPGPLGDDRRGRQTDRNFAAGVEGCVEVVGVVVDVLSHLGSLQEFQNVTMHQFLKLQVRKDELDKVLCRFCRNQCDK